jgi:hypothetical protein
MSFVLGVSPSFRCYTLCRAATIFFYPEKSWERCESVCLVPKLTNLMMTMTSKASATGLFLVLLGFVCIIFFQKSNLLHTTGLHDDEEAAFSNPDGGDEIILDETGTPFTQNRTARLSELLRPRTLKFDANGVAYPHQLLHLHHMKTGGTSTDLLLRCSIQKMTSNQNNSPTNTVAVAYNTIHECSASFYQNCVQGKDKGCLDRANAAAVMSYCAPMADLPIFGWHNVTEVRFGDCCRSLVPTTITSCTSPLVSFDSILKMYENAHTRTNTPSLQMDKITVLRHPVDRVWSMYRFQTKSCYSCEPLAKIYEKIDAGGHANLLRPNCQNQLRNHLVRNMLANKVDDAVALNRASLAEAVEHLSTFVLGLTDRLQESAAAMQKVFTFLQGCELQHANESPVNNGCGPGGTHLPLGDHPDNETEALILAHNELDMELYEAALEQYDLQMRLLADMD